MFWFSWYMYVYSLAGMGFIWESKFGHMKWFMPSHSLESFFLLTTTFPDSHLLTPSHFFFFPRGGSKLNGINNISCWFQRNVYCYKQWIRQMIETKWFTQRSCVGMHYTVQAEHASQRLWDALYISLTCILLPRQKLLSLIWIRFLGEFFPPLLSANCIHGHDIPVHVGNAIFQ